MEVLYLKCSNYDINFVNVRKLHYLIKTYRGGEDYFLCDLEEKSMIIIKDQ